MFSTPRLLDQPLERGDVHVALEGQDRLRIVRRRQVDRLGAGVLDVGARRVEVGVVGDDLRRTAEDGEQDLLRRAALVRWDDVLEREELLDRAEEAIPRRRPGVALIAVLDRGPLVAAHRARARVGQQVDDHVRGVDVEEVVARLHERLPRARRRSSSGSARPSGSGRAR